MSLSPRSLAQRRQRVQWPERWPWSHMASGFGSRIWMVLLIVPAWGLPGGFHALLTVKCLGQCLSHVLAGCGYHCVITKSRMQPLGGEAGALPAGR